MVVDAVSRCTLHSGTTLIAAQPALLLSGAAVAEGTLTGYLGRMLWGGGRMFGPTNNWLVRCQAPRDAPGPLQVYGLSLPDGGPDGEHQQTEIVAFILEMGSF